MASADLNRGGLLKRPPTFFGFYMRKNLLRRWSGPDGPTGRKFAAMRTGAMLMAMLGLLTLAADGLAFSYRPAKAVSIMSEYGASDAAAPRHTQVWKVVPEAGPDGVVTLRFFPEAIAGADALCVLRLPAPGQAEAIRWEGVGTSREKRSDTGLLLVPGFPAPCDILPVGETPEGRVYQEKSEAGGRVFIRRYRLLTQPSSAGEAKDMGWIRAEAEKTVQSALIMVTVTDEKGRLVVRQLWPADGAWWFYEETPLRRSWLID
jgi:hypothetical protein